MPTTNIFNRSSRRLSISIRRYTRCGDGSTSRTTSSRTTSVVWALSQRAERYLFTAVDEAWCVDLAGRGIWALRCPTNEPQQQHTVSLRIGTSDSPHCPPGPWSGVVAGTPPPPTHHHRYYSENSRALPATCDNIANIRSMSVRKEVGLWVKLGERSSTQMLIDLVGKQAVTWPGELGRTRAYPPKGPHANKPKLTAYVVMDMASAPPELADDFAKFARKWNLGVCPVLNANGCLAGNGHEQENV